MVEAALETPQLNRGGGDVGLACCKLADNLTLCDKGYIDRMGCAPARHSVGFWLARLDAVEQ